MSAAPVDGEALRARIGHRAHGQPGPSIEEFYASTDFVRVMVGGRGSGKTRGLAEDITGHIWMNAGAKAIIARETEISQADSSIDTFLLYYESLGPVYTVSGLGLFRTWNNGRTIRVPSRLAVERMLTECAELKTRSEIAHWIKTVGAPLCGHIEFRGLPAANKGKFRGMECSYLALVEADQIIRKQFELSLACLRWKGADPATCDEKGFIRDRCVVLDTNPPSPSHWIAEFEKEQQALPPAERIARFWHVSTFENEHNLPPGYIHDTIITPYASNPAMIERMLYGRYCDAWDGKAVFHEYRMAEHEGEDLPFPRGAYLIRGWDFGTFNAVIWSSYWSETYADEKGNEVVEEYWQDLYEQYMEGSDTDTQAAAAIETTLREFPFWNDRTICAGVLDFCDPAGAASAYTRKIKVNGKNVEESAVNILRTHNIFPGFTARARGLQETIAIVNRLMARRDRAGRRVYRVDRKYCPRLARGYRGGYRYPSQGEPGYDSGEPIKGALCEHLDHCFTAGTEIMTAAGPRRIEEIQSGDLVLTRYGFRPVIGTMNRIDSVEKYRMPNGETLEGTRNHRVWTENRGWVPLYRLMQGDTLRLCTPIANLLFFAAGFIDDILKPRGDRTACISSARVATSIGMFGRFITALFLRGCTSITKTGIRSIMTSETSKCSRQGSISERLDLTTPRPAATRPGRPPGKLSMPLACGINPRAEGNGIESTPKGWGSEQSARYAYDAKTADETKISGQRQEPPQRSGFALIIANLGSAQKAASMTRRGCALLAVKISGLIGIRRRRLARCPAASGTERRARVYNVEVGDVPEYFANGVLVHNCQDAARYAKINALRLMNTGAPKADAPNHAKNTTNPNPARKI
jgi:hypothetical protein